MSRGPYHVWTLPELRAAQRRRQGGEPTAAIAATVGVTPGALRQAWRTYLGWCCQPTRFQEQRPTPRRDLLVHTRRAAGVSFRDIAAELGETYSRRWMNRERQRQKRYAARVGVQEPRRVYPSGRTREISK